MPVPQLSHVALQVSMEQYHGTLGTMIWADCYFPQPLLSFLSYIPWLLQK
jgi:hypothetical protein